MMTILKQKLLMACMLSLCLLTSNAYSTDCMEMCDFDDDACMASCTAKGGNAGGGMDLGDDMLAGDDSDESFCREMCPAGDSACTYENCMKIAQASKPKAPAAAAPAPAPAAPAQIMNRPMVMPNPACKGIQSACCMLDNSCIPGCPIARNLCIKK